LARINPDLLERLQDKLGLSQRRVYDLIDAKVRASHLPRPLAAVALAAERGINISRFATEDDLASLRSSAAASAPPPVVVPAPTDSSRRARSPGLRKTHQTRQRRRGNSVFVVHGRNESARVAVFSFLRALKLEPIEWNQAIKMTGGGAPYVGSILETVFREAVAVVVLFTPDDEARLRKKFRKAKEPPHETELTGQARANVLFEAGMALGRKPESTVLVQVGDVRPFSDVAGRHVVHLANTPTSRQELATKLANAGCNVDTTGTDWLSVGDFSS